MPIVVVDSDRIGLMLVAELLGRLRQPIERFTTAAAALEWMAGHQPHLLITDLRLDGMDGIALTARLRNLAHTADMPVVLLITAQDRERRGEAIAAGVTDFALKPVDPTELFARASALLRLALAQAALRTREAHLASEVDLAASALAAREEEIIRRLSAAADRHDQVTGDHIARVATYAGLLARGLGLPEDEVRLITLAAPLHDIGKIGIPDGLLTKRGELSAEERQVMEKHTVYAEEILGNSTWELLRVAAEIGAGHHEHWDGTGYPRGLSGTGIPLPARIVAVADVFDALVSERPYKSAWPLEAARAQLLAERGRQFDPACVDAFLACWDEARAIAERAATA